MKHLRQFVKSWTTLSLRRYDRVMVSSGFFQGYGGSIVDKRWFVWYGLNVGGRVIYIPRWNLRWIGVKNPVLHDKIRQRMIDQDRKENK